MGSNKKSIYPIDGHFVGIPYKIVLKDKIWRKLSPCARVIFETMATKFSRWEKDGQLVLWSHENLAATTGIPKTTMRRGLKELKLHSLVRVEHPGGRYSTETQYALNLYYLTGKQYPDW